MSLALNIGLVVIAAILVNALWRIGERFLGSRHTPKHLDEWAEEVRKVLFALVDCDIDKHNLEARLAHLLGKQPPEYDGLAAEAFKRQLLLHPAMAAKAEEMGLFPQGTFERMGVPNYQSFNPIAYAEAPAPPQAPEHQATPSTPPQLKVIGTVVTGVAS